MKEAVLQTLHSSRLRATGAQQALRQLGYAAQPATTKPKKGVTRAHFNPDEIHRKLEQISPALANSYAQVRIDIQDDERLSWAGTAHEIREIVSHLLHELAPDAAVKAQKWYVQDKNTSGPTQKQRAQYILEQHSAGSKESESAENVDALDERISNLVRATYTRASVAAHRYKEQREVRRILNYFEAFAHDLLNLE